MPEVRHLRGDDGVLVSHADDRQGNHLKHRTKNGRVTVSGKLSADLQPGTLKSILRQAGLKD